MELTADIQKPSARGQSSDRRLAGRLMLAAIVLSLTCRTVQYLADRSFWHDEASLVLNIREKTAGQLMGRLDYEQASPPLFLLADARSIECWAAPS